MQLNDSLENFDPVATAQKGTYWQPFTSSRVLQANPVPRTLVSAKGAYYQTLDGHKVFDTLSGLWCTPLGHAHPLIGEAIQKQFEKLDFSPSFQLTHSGALSLAQRIADMAPEGMNHVFFTNSGSEAVDTALKVALGYHRIKGAANRFRMIGRERGYHGVGFGGMSVGGILSNRKMFAAGMMPGVDHLRHTYDPAHMAFTRGQPSWGADRVEDLERLVALHDASTIAAVIVEPVQGSTGVIVPPLGYLKRLREICTKHGILLIFDEVITGFGRMGAPFASQRFDVKPDIITFAKAITNGIVPMGGVIVTDEIYKTFMTGPQSAIEFCHGYTYSGHPLAAAVGHVVLDITESEGLFERVKELEPVLEDAAHSLKGIPHIADIRNIGLTAAVELKPAEEGLGVRGAAVFEEALKQGLLLRVTGDIISFGPPFISTEEELKSMMVTLGKVISEV
ncbi:omega amino acid--pyruvate aminotransferase [Acetobacter indonesiensis]|uniref:aspartate aminotransferase family protein n=1 Tax=Acetobacter indonesiensis TaxID=104101 RepID=UPI000A38A4CF|nr:aspartate aminotransferase family protein [Acetobacter indonesiensis]OUI92735.1 omega amino acid--pyruvate aminotransferase [Acetobacter indonesiensis]